MRGRLPPMQPQRGVTLTRSSYLQLMPTVDHGAVCRNAKKRASVRAWSLKLSFNIKTDAETGHSRGAVPGFRMRQKCGRETNRKTPLPRADSGFRPPLQGLSKLLRSWSGVREEAERRRQNQEQNALGCCRSCRCSRSESIILNSRTPANPRKLSKKLLFRGLPLPIVKARALVAGFHRPHGREQS